MSVLSSNTTDNHIIVQEFLLWLKLKVLLCPDFFPSFSSLIAELEGTSFPCGLTALCCSCPAFFLSDCCSLRLPLPLLHLPHFCLYKGALLALWERPPLFPSMLLTSKRPSWALPYPLPYLLLSHSFTLSFALLLSPLLLVFTSPLIG